jgi:hypothetical protein
LSTAEKKYPHTQKEALSTVWGIERFTIYLLNVSFTIRTDAESNEFIFGGMHRIGKRAVSRAEAWALRLQPYDFKVVRVPGEINTAHYLGLYQKFVKTWEDRGVKITKAIPLSAQSNDTVERQNKGLKDALTAAKLDNVNWKLALQQYLHMHNKVRPLPRLGVTPFELLVGWRFRGTFPFLWDSLHADQVDRADIREKDAMSKLDSKQYADLIRGAKESEITVGDKVLMAQQSKNKGEPTFSGKRWCKSRDNE